MNSLNQPASRRGAKGQAARGKSGRAATFIDFRQIDRAVGARIRVRRRELGLSQSVIAEAIGVSCQQFQKYEQGTNRISVGKLVVLAAALDVAAADFLPDIEAGAGGFRLAASEGEGATALSRGAISLAQSYDRIADAKARDAVRSLVHVMAQAFSEPGSE